MFSCRVRKRFVNVSSLSFVLTKHVDFAPTSLYGGGLDASGTSSLLLLPRGKREATKRRESKHFLFVHLLIPSPMSLLTISLHTVDIYQNDTLTVWQV